MAHFLVTGHTGFKGSWLTLLLREIGHTVSGLSLDPFPESIFARSDIGSLLEGDFRADIRNLDSVYTTFEASKPDYVIHMAAQALVLEGYRDPGYTYETNVQGTLNVLRAIDATASVRGSLIVTTDKVYRNDESGRYFEENDPLGGRDPYSASKAMADLLAQEWLGRAGSKPGAVLRAGNVIGLGDSSNYRLIPDVIRATQTGDPVKVRNAESVRPWQHVLDCLRGYLMVLESLGDGHNTTVWNIGPPDENYKSVEEVIALAKAKLGDFRFQVQFVGSKNTEDGTLKLSSEKASTLLGWKNLLSLEEALEWALFEAQEHSSSSIMDVMVQQIRSFQSRI